MFDIIISGINGKIGNLVYKQSKKNGFNVVCGVDRNIIGEFDCPVYKSFDEIKTYADVVIDFSSPDLIEGIFKFATQSHIPVVLGTTGYDEHQEVEIKTAAEKVAVFRSDNFSLGINVVKKLCFEATKRLSDFDIEIIDVHHRNKLDSPSGTTNVIYDSIVSALDEKKIAVYGRNGAKRRSKNEIGIHSVRGGSVVGEHEILFLGGNESITIKHTAYSKELFADGAIKAARFIKNKKVGLYGMDDLLS